MSIETIKDAKTIIQYIKDNLEKLTPQEVSDFTVRLAISFGNLGQELAKSEAAYARSWLDIRKNCSTVAEADKQSKATPEYLMKKELEYSVKGLKEVINALKKRQALLSDEAKMQY